jgi:hypothetical protein
MKKATFRLLRLSSVAESMAFCITFHENERKKVTTYFFVFKLIPLKKLRAVVVKKMSKKK